MSNVTNTKLNRPGRENIAAAGFDFSKIHRIIVKIGSNSLTHPETGHLDFVKIEHLVRELSDLKNRGLDVCLVSSGAIAIGRQNLGITERPKSLPQRQALAAVGQARLMSVYQNFFREYGQVSGQVLMTKATMIDNVSRKNAQNTFNELFREGVIPIVNENDTISTYEIQFGDNDTLSAMVAALTDADLLVLLSDIDGLYSNDPKKDPDAKLIPLIDRLDDHILSMASDQPGSDVGTGGMSTKLRAAKIVVNSGIAMLIANADHVGVLHRMFQGSVEGSLFLPHLDEDFDLIDFLEDDIG